MIYLGWLLAAAAVVIILIAAVGVWKLPDALARQHAATKAATLGVTLLSLGLILFAMGSGWGWDWVVRLLVLLVFLTFTLPLASHALARAAVSERALQDRNDDEAPGSSRH